MYMEAKRIIDINTRKRNVNLWFINDIHVGAACFAEKEFLSTIEKIKKDSKAVVILNGDLGDYIKAGDPRYLANDVDLRYPDPEDQYFKIVELLQPIKNKIIAVGMGIHEFSIWKYHGFNLTKMLAREFDCDYYIDFAIVNLKVTKNTFRILVTHGAGGSGTVGGVERWIKTQVQKMQVAPDICAVGHFHMLDVFATPVFDSEFNTKPTYFAVTGGFYKNYPDRGLSTFASRSAFRPNLIGTVMFELFQDGNIIDHKIIES